MQPEPLLGSSRRYREGYFPTQSQYNIEIQSAWIKWDSTRSEESASDILALMTPLFSSIASKYASHLRDDLMGVCKMMLCFELCHPTQKYKAQGSGSFSTKVFTMAQRACFDYKFTESGLIHRREASRVASGDEARLRGFVATLSRYLGRDMNETEVSSIKAMSVVEIAHFVTMMSRSKQYNDDIGAVSTRFEDRACDEVILRSAIEKLPQAQREVVELYFYGQMTQQEIGDKLGKRKQTVCRHLSRALDGLKKDAGVASLSD